MTIETVFEIIEEEVKKGLEEFNYSNVKRAILKHELYSTNEGISYEDDSSVKEAIENIFDAPGFLNNTARKKHFVYARYCYFWYLTSILKLTDAQASARTKYDRVSIYHGRKKVNESTVWGYHHREIQQFLKLF